jgi:tetratricopeptide (TPR) repeat protein
LLWELGQQLVPDFAGQAKEDAKREWQLVERALRDRPTLLVIDNVESVLPPYGWAAGPNEEEPAGFDPDLLAEILELCRKLVETGETRLVFTSRSPLPAPFDDRRRALDVGRLSPSEALELVGNVLGEGGRIPGTRTDLESREKVEELVAVLGGHARSLVLIARELRGGQPLGETTEGVRRIMARLEKQHPGEREQSLFASVELSLRKLPPDLRAKLPPLGVFHGGGNVVSIGRVLELGTEKGEHAALARALIDVGLAELLEYNYLRLDPALGPFLLRGLDDPARATAETCWAEATAQLMVFLNEHQSSDPRLAAVLTLQELPNLLAAIEWHWRAAPSPVEPYGAETFSPGAAPGVAIDLESVIEQANRVERLLQYLGRPRALHRAVALRERAAAMLKEPGWSRTRYLTGSSTIERLLDAGRAAQAVPLARRLVAEALAAGEAAYDGACFELAMCHAYLGRALRQSGEAEAALVPLLEALTRFRKLADAGDRTAAHTASVCLTDRADALRELGRLDEAASSYEESIQLSEQQDTPRQAAVNRGNLGTVRLLQGRHLEALEAYEQARQTFEHLGEPTVVAGMWHQAGMVFRTIGPFNEAEKAYLNARRISVDLGDRPGEARTLGELGTLYGDMGRLEDAVRLHREATMIYADHAVSDPHMEGRGRTNVAYSLWQLGRLGEARSEVERAIVCKQPFGHAAVPWTTFGLLSEIERDAGRLEASLKARRRAIEAYLAYRRDGGENQTGDLTARLCEDALGAVQRGQVESYRLILDQLQARADRPAYLAPVLTALRAVLAGSRDPAQVDDPALDYHDAAEILMLLERLRIRAAPSVNASSGRVPGTPFLSRSGCGLARSLGRSAWSFSTW